MRAKSDFPSRSVSLTSSNTVRRQVDKKVDKSANSGFTNKANLLQLSPGITA